MRDTAKHALRAEGLTDMLAGKRLSLRSVITEGPKGMRGRTVVVVLDDAAEIANLKAAAEHWLRHHPPEGSE